jgi:hypothetical protein
MKENSLEVPRIETDRLLLRELTRNDLEFLFDHFSKDEINECSSQDNLKSMEETEEFFKKYITPSPT